MFIFFNTVACTVLIKFYLSNLYHIVIYVLIYVRTFTGFEVCNDALQMLGGYGYLKVSGAGHYYFFFCEKQSTLNVSFARRTIIIHNLSFYTNFSFGTG